MFNEDSAFSCTAVNSVAELGHRIRLRRKSLGMTLQTVSGLTGIGYRYLSELERGKETAEIGKALRAMRFLGLEIAIVPKGSKSKGNDNA